MYTTDNSMVEYKMYIYYSCRPEGKLIFYVNLNQAIYLAKFVIFFFLFYYGQ